MGAREPAGPACGAAVRGGPAGAGLLAEVGLGAAPRALAPAGSGAGAPSASPLPPGFPREGAAGVAAVGGAGEGAGEAATVGARLPGA